MESLQKIPRLPVKANYQIHMIQLRYIKQTMILAVMNAIYAIEL